MRARGCILAILVSIRLWGISPICAQSLPVPEVVSPQNQQLYAWGKAKPSIRIEVRVAPSSSVVRHFVTANILTTTGRLVDRVSLYDDGSHMDTVASDGLFTNVYIPHEQGTFQIRARLQQTDIASRVNREKWSEPTAFSVVQVPYVDITSPNHDAQVTSVTKVSASLLVGSQQQLYRPADNEVRVRCWTEPAGKAIVPQNPSSSFSARVEFPRPGRYRLFMAAQTLCEGQWIESEPDSVWVNVLHPPMWPFWAAALLVVAALLMPSKQVWLYKHILDIHDKDGGVHTVEVHPQKLREVRETVGGTDSTQQIPGATDTLFTLIAKPGEEFLHVQIGGKDEWIEVRPHTSTIAFAAGDWTVYYRERKAAGKVKLPLWSLTKLKRVLISLAVAILLYGIWMYWHFTQMLPSS